MHAQDRFWEMDFRRHVTAGRVAELFGESQVATDAFIRTLDWRGIAEQEYALLDEVSRAYYDAYAEGVNAYLGQRDGADLSLEYAVLGLQNPGYTPEPWTPVDSIAWLKAMAWDLRSNLGRRDRSRPARRGAAARGGRPPASRVRVRVRCRRSSRGRRRAPPPRRLAADVAPSADDAGTAASDLAIAAAVAAPLASLSALLDDVPELLGPEGGDLGSNSWVVSGALTESGLPAARERPAPRPGDAVHLGADGAALRRAPRRLRLRRRRLHVLGAAGRHHRPQRAHRLGVHEPRSRRRGPLPRARRRRHVRARRRHGPAHPARGDHRGRRRRPGDHHGALDRPRADRHRHRVGLRRRSPTSTPRHPANPTASTAVSLQWTALDAGHHAAGRLRPEPRAGLERLPGGRVAVRRARPEPHLRRRRRQHRLPGARHRSPCVRPATARCRCRAGRAPTGGRAPSRSTSCRRCSTPPAATSSRRTTR